MAKMKRTLYNLISKKILQIEKDQTTHNKADGFSNIEWIRYMLDNITSNFSYNRGRLTSRNEEFFFLFVCFSTPFRTKCDIANVVCLNYSSFGWMTHVN